MIDSDKFNNVIIFLSLVVTILSILRGEAVEQGNEF